MDQHIEDLAAYVQASPSSYHAVAEGARRLLAAGFEEQDETQAWDSSAGGHFVRRDGALIAWRVPVSAGPLTPYRMVGSHTDSPAFKLKPKPTTGSAGWLQAGVEVYGGPLLNSWLDRDLALAGRLVTRDGREALVETGPIMRIPQLAIHLDRMVNESGVKLEKQRHTAPVWGLGDPTQADLLGVLAGVADLDPADIGGYDVVTVDTQAPQIIGAKQEFFASRRLDNLSSVHAGLAAVIAIEAPDAICMFAAFDHEEIGSQSRSGACGPLLGDVIRRIGNSLGADLDEHERAMAASVCLSADAGHAVHPNYSERHDPANRPLPNGGPMLKINANQRYTTDAHGAALWARACDAAGVPTQEFVSNNDLPCGSTIGPLTATRLGIRTLDVGIGLLSMHSARELAGVKDPGYLSRAMEAFYAGA